MSNTPVSNILGTLLNSQEGDTAVDDLDNTYANHVTKSGVDQAAFQKQVDAIIEKIEAREDDIDPDTMPDNVREAYDLILAGPQIGFFSAALALGPDADDDTIFDKVVDDFIAAAAVLGPWLDCNAPAA